MYCNFINAHLFELIFFSAWQQSDAAANGMAGSGIGSPVANLVSRLGSFTFRRTSSGRVETATDSESDEAASVGGSFFETLTSSEFYKNTKVIFCCTVFKNSYNLEVWINPEHKLCHCRLAISQGASGGHHFLHCRRLTHSLPCCCFCLSTE